MKAIYPMVGASAAACAQNLKSSSFTGTFTSGWTFASTGVKGNGISAYMNTNLNDLNDLGSTPTLSIYLNQIGTIHLGWQVGVFTSSSNLTGMSINNSNVGGNYQNIRSSLQINYTETFNGGLYTGTTDSNNNYIYKNNTIKATVSKISSGLNKTHYLGNLNGVNVPSDYQIAMAIFGDSNLTSTNMSDFYTAVQAFQTTLNREV